MAASPTQRTMQELRKDGATVAVVEKWNAWTGQRQDLFGFIDVMALFPKLRIILAVQATTAGNLAARYKKLMGEEALLMDWIVSGGKVQLWGWRLHKNGRNWGFLRRTIDMTDTGELLVTNERVRL